MDHQAIATATRQDWENDIEKYQSFLENNELTVIQRAAVGLLIKEANDRIADCFDEGNI